MCELVANCIKHPNDTIMVDKTKVMLSHLQYRLNKYDAMLIETVIAFVHLWTKTLDHIGTCRNKDMVIKKLKGEIEQAQKNEEEFRIALKKKTRTENPENRVRFPPLVPRVAYCHSWRQACSPHTDFTEVTSPQSAADIESDQSVHSPREDPKKHETLEQSGIGAGLAATPPTNIGSLPSNVCYDDPRPCVQYETLPESEYSDFTVETLPSSPSSISSQEDVESDGTDYRPGYQVNIPFERPASSSSTPVFPPIHNAKSQPSYLNETQKRYRKKVKKKTK